eukprot:scaffold71156_cov69-Phaeocystis_antarctica.AAC.4
MSALLVALMCWVSHAGVPAHGCGEQGGGECRCRGSDAHDEPVATGALAQRDAGQPARAPRRLCAGGHGRPPPHGRHRAASVPRPRRGTSLDARASVAHPRRGTSRRAPQACGSRGPPLCPACRQDRCDRTSPRTGRRQEGEQGAPEGPEGEQEDAQGEDDQGEDAQGDQVQLGDPGDAVGGERDWRNGIAPACRDEWLRRWGSRTVTQQSVSYRVQSQLEVRHSQNRSMFW